MKPSPSLPTRFSDGMKQSSKMSSEVSLARRPSLFSFSRTKSPGSLLHHEGRQAAGVGGTVGYRDHHGDIGVVAIGDEGFVAVQHPAAFALHCGHARATGVRTGGRFGQPPRTEVFSGSQPADVFLFLRLVAGNKKMIAAQRRVGRHNDAYRTIHARQFFDGRDVFNISHPGAAVFLGENRPQQAQFAQFLDGGHGELGGFVPLHDAGSDFALGKLAHTFLELKLLVVQLKIQSSSGITDRFCGIIRCGRGRKARASQGQHLSLEHSP